MKPFLLTLILFTSHRLISQVKFLCGPELGVNVSGIQSVNDSKPGDSYVTEITNTPVFAPIVGFFGEVQFGQNFLINADLYYTKVGNTYYQLTYTDVLPENTYELYIEQDFNVSSLPILVGYRFLIGNSQFQIKTGYVFNYFFNGDRIINEKFSDSSSSIGTHSQLNPFDPEYFYIPASHWNNQWKLSIGMNIKENWNLNIFSSLGYELHYVDQNQFGGDSYGGTSLNNFDLGLIIKYNIVKSNRN